MRPLRFALAVSATLFAASDLSAAAARMPDRVQVADGPVAPASAPIARADRLHASGAPDSALLVLREVVAEDSLAFEALWRIARAEVNLGMLGSEPVEERYRAAEGAARKAIRVAPERPEGHHWASVALGRLALGAGIRERVRMAEEVRALADAVLGLDPDHAGAHHVLGRWHAEVMGLSGLSRWIASSILGGDRLDEASWEAAEAHLRRAAELEPLNPHHALELGRLLLDRERTEEAFESLRRVLELPMTEPVDPLYREEATALLSGG